MDKTCHFYPPHHGFVTGNKPVTPVTRVWVLLGYGFTYPYPNPSSTRLFTPGFGLPMAIPTYDSCQHVGSSLWSLLVITMFYYIKIKKQ